MSVLVRGRASDRLAPGASRLVRARRRRAGRAGGDGGHRRGPDQPVGRRHLDRRAGRGLPADHRLRPLAGRGAGHPARARRPQGVLPPAVGRPRDRAAGGRRLGPGRADRAALPGAGHAGRADHRAAARAGRGLAVGRGPGRRRRLRGDRDPLRARLPAARVPLPADQHPHRRVRREPGPAAHRGGRRGPGGLARAQAAVRPAHRQRLGARRADRGRRGRGGQRPGRARRRPVRRLQRRAGRRPAGRRRAGLPGAVRPRGPRAGRDADRSRRADHRARAGRAGAGRRFRRCGHAGPRGAAGPELAAARRVRAEPRRDRGSGRALLGAAVRAGPPTPG